MTERVETKLTELGLSLPAPLVLPSPNRIAAKLVGTTLYISGHGSDLLDDDSVKRHGRVPDRVSAEEAYETTRALALKMLATAKWAIGDLDRIAEIINLKGYVYSHPDFDAMNAVINGASDLLFEVFGDPAGVHTRSTIGVTALVKNQSVEIDAVMRLHE
ncbi:Enamine deaminase RidA, house cleaning of reactive enamine intermediates, YjgF/YER057c/UK114 family [Parasphingorhabdus marina DSM 22363]|uniref:Enamine deaminase RidA, house cleaning of reactive enamine intermediates, YjgF/YER057c/UK114 family n=1 Tax=Parasphingorhabdus marina DSM 22363 TaxID=1123272 RepID=A0A1N6D3I7_9SPHN|nr:RidA family protein [Parasphingorhabdus marina]SIN65355.1 Enamine deaminase RidA, house cleaning of reactive enamine intermediates, YjgF/YER057c/UK114 family [Parasphingorhabdus marina DSM 22363]